MRVKVGDKLEIIEGFNEYHYFPHGSIVTVETVFEELTGYVFARGTTRHYGETHENDGQYLRAKHWKHVIPQKFVATNGFAKFAKEKLNASTY